MQVKKRTRKRLSKKERKEKATDLADAKFWNKYSALCRNYYPAVPQDLLSGHSIDIPSFSRFLTKDDHYIVDNSPVHKIDHEKLNSAQSLQSHCLWDLLIVSGYRRIDIHYYDKISFDSSY